ncbi:MAG: restriction endonuclease subunit S [Clostridia bacterium]|nr:restriction endonuclease subunit S [Clostridia bacterium]
MTPQVKQRIEQIRRGEVPEGYKKTRVGVVPNEWEEIRFKNMFSRVTRKNKENNDNVLTISAQYGLINQRDFFNKDIASDDKSNYYLLENGEYAYNKSYSNGYPYGALKRLDMYDKGIVSPLYICFAANEENKCPDFYIHYFEAGKMNREIQAFAQEGARNHGLLNISVDDFFNSNIVAPSLPEQEKIAEILSAQDKLIALKEKLIEEKKRHKKALMQQLLTGKKRLPGFSSEWTRQKMSDILCERKEENKDQSLRICSVAVNSGVVDQREHLGKSMAASDTSNYNVVHYGDIVYTKSPTGAFPYGIVKQSQLTENVAVSPLYGVYEPASYEIGYLLNEYFVYPNNTNGYLLPIINKGAKNTINISNATFITPSLYLPTNFEEIKKLVQIFKVANKEIKLLQRELDQEKQKKKALMQLLLTGVVRTI